MTILFPISSDDCIGSPYDFQLKNVPFLDVSKQYQGSVIQVIIANARGTFQTGFNDQFNYQVGGVAYTYTFTQSLWSGTAIAAALQTELQTRNGGFTVMWDSTNYQFDIYIPAAVQFYLDYSTLNSQYCFQLLGLEAVAGSTYVGALTLIGQVVRINGTKWVDVMINCPTSGIHPLGYQGWIARVPVDKSYANDLWYEPPQVTLGFGINGGQLANLRFTLIDQWGQPFKIDTNQTTSVVLRLD